MRLTALSEAVAEVGIRGLCEYFISLIVFKRYFQGALNFASIFFFRGNLQSFASFRKRAILAGRS